MRVLVVTEQCDRSETDLYIRLRRAGIELEVLCDPQSVRYDELEAADVPVRPLVFRSRLDVAAMRRLRHSATSGAFDIVHTFSKRALTHAMLATRGLNLRLLTYRGIIGNLSRWNPEARWTFFNPRLDGIVCVCHAVRDYLRALDIPEHKLRTIHKGHDLAWYRPAARDRLEAFGIPSGVPVAGCAAHMRARKGGSTLMDALARLPRGSLHLLLLGEVSDGKIARQVRELGLQAVVHMPGYRTDAAALMGACDLFVMPSLRREGLPRAVIEAMAQQVPAVVTRVGGMPEIVEDGRSGLLVPSGDAAALAQALQTLAGDSARRRAMGAAARERIRTAFDIRDTVARTAQWYEELMR